MGLQKTNFIMDFSASSRFPIQAFDLTIKRLLNRCFLLSRDGSCPINKVRHTNMKLYLEHCWSSLLRKAFSRKERSRCERRAHRQSNRVCKHEGKSFRYVVLVSHKMAHKNGRTICHYLESITRYLELSSRTHFNRFATTLRQQLGAYMTTKT